MIQRDGHTFKCFAEQPKDEWLLHKHDLLTRLEVSASDNAPATIGNLLDLEPMVVSDLIVAALGLYEIRRGHPQKGRSCCRREMIT
jgi:hypothetical protein